MRNEMKGGRAFRELSESGESKESKVNSTVPARRRFWGSICSAEPVITKGKATQPEKESPCQANLLVKQSDQMAEQDLSYSSSLSL